MTFQIRATIAVVCGLTSLAPAMAHADYVYQYVGSTFNYGMTQGVTYTPATNNLVATLDSASALAANTTYTFAFGTGPSISLAIGLGTETCNFPYACNDGGSITTNSRGAIRSWSLYIDNNLGTVTINGSSTAAIYNVPSVSIGGPPSFASVPLYDALFASNGLAGPDYVEGSTTPGTWSASPVPLPAGGWLLLSGIGGFGLLIGWRRRLPILRDAGL
jgi:hypothetical protein